MKKISINNSLEDLSLDLSKYFMLSVMVGVILLNSCWEKIEDDWEKFAEDISTMSSLQNLKIIISEYFLP